MKESPARSTRSRMKTPSGRSAMGVSTVVMLEALHRVGAEGADLLGERLEHPRQTAGVDDRGLEDLDALGLEGEPAQGLAHVLHAGAEQLAPLDEVALVV